MSKSTRKNTVIIGASSGIGREAARIFSKEGHKLICAARDEDELILVANDLKIRYETAVHPIAVDLADRSSVRSFSKTLFEIFNQIDCLIITAGSIPGSDTPYYDEEALMKTIMVNYVGITMIVNEVARNMVQRKKGVIICLGSVAGERGRQNNLLYGASKSALHTYLQGLRMTLDRENVRVVTVVPGYVDTPMSYGKINKHLSVTPQYVAKRIYRLTQAKRNVVYIPWIWWIIMRLFQLVPECIFKKLGSIIK